MCVDQKGELDDTYGYYLFRQIAAYERFIRQHFTFDFHYAICCSKGFVSLIWFPFPGRNEDADVDEAEDEDPKTVNTEAHTHTRQCLLCWPFWAYKRQGRPLKCWQLFTTIREWLSGRIKGGDDLPTWALH